MKKNILITGAAGFIGFHLVNKLLSEGFNIIGLDNINAYYDVQLKLDRLSETGIESSTIAYNKLLNSSKHQNYKFIQLNLEDKQNIEKLFEISHFTKVIHLAAQAGVRYSIDNPQTYIDSNITGFFNILESCRKYPVEHLVFASSSSVYGNNSKVPFSEDDATDEPISLYAATKKSNELMAHTYSHLYKIPITGLRFFTVYGPWGRPDMAYFKFAKAITEGKSISVYNGGDLSRDFTYIDDIVDGILKVTHATKATNFEVLNIGNSSPVKLIDFINILEKAMDKQAEKVMFPMQQGDTEKTWADVSKLETMFDYRPKTDLTTGIANFYKWFLKYHSK